MLFRPGIEGLRGIAVILVVLAHAKVPGIAAGFIGVDVFFVISGFLITALLTQELEASGRVDYWNFFARRAKRLAPAMLTMVLAVATSAVIFLPRDVLALQLESGFWAALWASNFHFSFAKFDYFGSAAADSLFLHTWSLGVEEQFYLVWPWVTALAFRHWGKSSLWLAGLTVAGFLLCLVFLWVDATSGYYLMPARLWQLAVGALAYRLIEGNKALFAAKTDFAGCLGIVLLVGAVIIVDGERTYPGWTSLLPTLSAVGLLIAGYSGTGKVNWLLSTTLLRLPGRVSYSWYLWHWPFLMFLPVVGYGWPTSTQVFAIVLVSFLVAWMSYQVIEEPFRRTRGPTTARKTVAASLLASVMLASILLLGSKVLVEDGGRVRERSTLEGRVFSQLSVPAIYGIEGCDQWYHSAELVPCSVPAGGGGGGAIVVIADSVGAQWVPAFEYVARMHDRELIVLTKSSCAIVDEPFFYTRINRRFTECETWRDRAIAYVQETSPDVVVIGSTGTYEFTPEQWRDGSFRILRRLAAPGRTLLVLAPTPILPFHGPRCVVAQGSESAGVLEAPRCSSPLSEIENNIVIQALNEAAEGTPGGALINMNDQVCHQGACYAVLDGVLVYRDEQHLNATFAATLGHALDDRVQRILESNTD